MPNTTLPMLAGTLDGDPRIGPMKSPTLGDEMMQEGNRPADTRE